MESFDLTELDGLVIVPSKKLEGEIATCKCLLTGKSPESHSLSNQYVFNPLGSHEATVESDHPGQTHLVKDGPSRAEGQCHSTCGIQQVHRRE